VQVGLLCAVVAAWIRTCSCDMFVCAFEFRLLVLCGV
jgi:hypothetical protein